MAVPEDQHLAALGLYRNAFALIKESHDPENIDAATKIAEADAIMSKATFDFFRLPREIRDMVYDECLGIRQCEDDDDIHLKYAVQKTATPECICSQFQEEYCKRAKKQQGLVPFYSGTHEDP